MWYPNDTAWTDYYFIKNLQGDVLSVHKASDGTLAASYSYDSWGNILSKSGSLASINPFRYRSYYFDEQMWFYYLESRYYDPAIGRFINADVFASTGQGVLGYNMFAYCNNNPICNVDSSGMLFFTALGAIVGAVSGAIDAYIQGKTGDEFAASVWSGATSGAISGFAADVISFTGATVGVAIGVMAVAAAAGEAMGAGVEYLITGEPVDRGELIGDMAMSAATSALFAYMGGPIPSQKGKIAEKGFWSAAYWFYKKEIQNLGENVAEEALTTVAAGLADFTAKYFCSAVEYSAQMWK